jgi:hypothetical protein
LDICNFHDSIAFCCVLHRFVSRALVLHRFCRASVVLARRHFYTVSVALVRRRLPKLRIHRRAP